MSDDSPESSHITHGTLGAAFVSAYADTGGLDMSEASGGVLALAMFAAARGNAMKLRERTRATAAELAASGIDRDDDGVLLAKILATAETVLEAWPPVLMALVLAYIAENLDADDGEK